MAVTPPREIKQRMLDTSASCPKNMPQHHTATGGCLCLSTCAQGVDASSMGKGHPPRGRQKSSLASQKRIICAAGLGILHVPQDACNRSIRVRTQPSALEKIGVQKNGTTPAPFPALLPVAL